MYRARPPMNVSIAVIPSATGNTTGEERSIRPVSQAVSVPRDTFAVPPRLGSPGAAPPEGGTKWGQTW